MADVRKNSADMCLLGRKNGKEGSGGAAKPHGIEIRKLAWTKLMNYSS